MKQYIQAKILHMAQEEILTIIPKDTIARIKQSDPNPEFRVYCIGHEGEANPQILSYGQKIAMALKYVKDMVVKIADKLQFGTPIFHQHAGANTSDGREQIGEVVGKAVRTIQNRISALAAVYLYPQYRKMPLDIASIESINVFVPKSNSAAEVIDVREVTGIALASSATERPAFAGATLLGAIQALRGAETMTKEEIREAVREMKLKPMDLFEKSDIVATDVYQDLETKRKNEEGFARRKEKELQDEHEKVIDLNKKLDDANGKVKNLTQKVNTTTAKTHIETSLAGRKLDPKEREFILKNAQKFASDKEGDEFKQDVERFVDGQVKEFEGIAKDMGYEIKRPDAAPVNETPEQKAAREAAGGATGTPATDGANKGTGDMSDPTKNDFIPS